MPWQIKEIHWLYLEFKVRKMKQPPNKSLTGYIASEAAIVQRLLGRVEKLQGRHGRDVPTYLILVSGVYWPIGGHWEEFLLHGVH